MSQTITHEHLWTVCKSLPGDYTPYGALERWERDDLDYSDCSCGCRWYAKLSGPLGSDWGVCTNPASHRTGLLTFEHQGCLQFEAEEEASQGQREG